MLHVSLAACLISCMCAMAVVWGRYGLSSNDTHHLPAGLVLKNIIELVRSETRVSASRSSVHGNIEVLVAVIERLT